MDAFAPDGYVLLRQAVPHDALAAYPEALNAARDGLLSRRPDEPQVELASTAPEDAAPVDPYAIVDAARALLLPPPLVELLTAAYGDKPLLFDALGAGVAPDDGPYRDATYTALATEPGTLVTIVVALQTTTVAVHPGSQHIATTPFSGRYPAFNPERDGEAALDRHRQELQEQLGDSDTITLDLGDVLAWTAGLVHTAPHGDALVAHLCPARVQPAWFAYRPERARHAAAADGTAWLTTQHYDLVDAVVPEPPDGDGDDTPPQDDEAELQRVEAALREHDADNAPPPIAPHAEPRRHGGLVDSVRGMLGRRGRGGR